VCELPATRRKTQLHGYKVKVDREGFYQNLAKAIVPASDPKPKFTYNIRPEGQNSSESEGDNDDQGEMD